MSSITDSLNEKELDNLEKILIASKWAGIDTKQPGYVEHFVEYYVRGGSTFIIDCLADLIKNKVIKNTTDASNIMSFLQRILVSLKLKCQEELEGINIDRYIKKNGYHGKYRIERLRNYICGNISYVQPQSYYPAYDERENEEKNILFPFYLVIKTLEYHINYGCSNPEGQQKILRIMDDLILSPDLLSYFESKMLGCPEFWKDNVAIDDIISNTERYKVIAAENSSRGFFRRNKNLIPFEGLKEYIGKVDEDYKRKRKVSSIDSYL